MSKQLEEKINNIIEEKQTKEASGITSCNFDKNGNYVSPSAKKSSETESSSEEKKDDPLTIEEISDEEIRALKKTIKKLRENLIFIEQSWFKIKDEFKLTENQLKLVYQFNEQNRDEVPSDEENEDKYFNGIDKMTFDDIEKIFGEDHPIIGVDLSQTIDHIKQSFAAFFDWLSIRREYNKVDVAYMEMMDLKEEGEILKIQLSIKDMEDCEQKENLQKQINNYFYYKELKFLAEPMDDKTIKILVDTYGNEQKIRYWIERSRKKLKQISVNPKILLEISKFENNYLEEKYHCISNALLLRFINICTFTNFGDTKPNDERSQVTSMVMTIDSVIRNIIKDEKRENVLNNIRAYLDQMLEPLKKAYPVEVGGRKVVPDENNS